jgi:hypothetical protein
MQAMLAYILYEAQIRSTFGNGTSRPPVAQPHRSVVVALAGQLLQLGRALRRLIAGPGQAAKVVTVNPKASASRG